MKQKEVTKTFMIISNVRAKPALGQCLVYVGRDHTCCDTKSNAEKPHRITVSRDD